jgi:hypothetical protein
MDLGYNMPAKTWGDQDSDPDLVSGCGYADSGGHFNIQKENLCKIGD